MIEVHITNAGGRLKHLPPPHPVRNERGEHVLRSITDDLSDACAYFLPGAENHRLYKKIDAEGKRAWDGMKRLYSKRDNTFPLGLLSRVLDVLRAQGLQWRVIDERTGSRSHLRRIKLSDSVEKRGYQREAVAAAIDAKRSVLQVATGGGKTVIAAMLITELRCNTLFLVHTKDLLYQAKESFEANIENAQIGQIGDGVVDIQPITVATIQTISRLLGVEYKKYEYDDDDYRDSTDISGRVEDIRWIIDNADLVIWDEVHRIACDMAYNISEKITNATYRVGLSASPWRDDGQDMLIEAAMGHVSYKVSASFLIDKGFLVPPIIRRVPIPASIPPEQDRRDYLSIYRDEIVNNTHRNDMIVKYATDFMALDIPTLVLVQQIQHGRDLKRRITEEYHPIDFISGKDFSQTRLQAIQGMRDGERISLIASTIADEGLDIKRLAGLILAGGGKSSTRALQRVGRVLRSFPGKTHALIIDFADQSKYLADHSGRRKQIYMTEPRFLILEV